MGVKTIPGDCLREKLGNYSRIKENQEKYLWLNQ